MFSVKSISIAVVFALLLFVGVFAAGCGKKDTKSEDLINEEELEIVV